MQYQTTQYIIHHCPPPQVFTGFCSRYVCQNPVMVPQRCQAVLPWSLQLHLKPFSANLDSHKYAFPSAPGPFPMLGDLKKSRMGRVGLTEVELNALGNLSTKGGIEPEKEMFQPLFLYNILAIPCYCLAL
uniref:Uncharacterized protein n=1 Tax=Colobus angolensis palliatus TaxID=336983 RepID=A0A2K5K9M4_COLAP